MFDIFKLLVSIPVIAVVVIIVGLILFYNFKFRYKTVLSNELLVISGGGLKGANVHTDEHGRSVKILRGGGYYLRPFQTARKASLHSFQIHLETPTIYVKQGIPIVANAVATVKVADEIQNLVRFAEQYMGKKSDEIEREISNVLNANLRAILSKLTVEEINNDREHFSQQVQEIAEVELLNMGFTLTSFGLDDVRDAQANGYLTNLGRPRLAEMQEIAEKAESDANRNIRIHTAENDKQSKEEETRRRIEIAEIEKERELIVQKNLAETNKERAITEQTYELERSKREKEVEQEKLHIELMKRQEQLKQEEVERERVLLEARRDSEQREIQAKISASEREIQAQAEAKETEIRAEADKIRLVNEGQAHAESIKLREQAENTIMLERGKAEAQVILEKGKADAESRSLMAKAIQEYGEYAVIELLVSVLPQMVEGYAKVYDNVDEIKIIDMGGNDSEGGVNSLTNNLTKNLTGIQGVLSETTGMDFKDLLETYLSKGRNKFEAPKINVNTNVAQSETSEEHEEVDNVDVGESVHLDEDVPLIELDVEEDKE